MSRSLAIAAFVCAALAPAVSNAQECDRLPRDCDAEARTFEGRARRLTGLSAPVRAGLEALQLRRRSICLEWNACATEDATFERIHAWADRELQSLARARDDAARSTWARGLTARGNEAVLGTPATPTAYQLPPEQLAAVIRGLRQTRMQVEGARSLEPILVRIVRGAQTRGHEAPPVCSGGVSRELRSLLRSAESSSVRSYASSLLRALDDLCEPFERWNQPDEDLELQTLRFQSGMTRALEHLEALRHCVDPGPYDHRCENAYGPRSNGVPAETRRVIRLFTRARQTMAAEPRFPCHDPIWDELERTEWTVRVVKVQATGVANSARRLCSSLGIDDERIQQRTQTLRELAERSLAQGRQMVEQLEPVIRQQMEQWGDQFPEGALD